MITLYDLAEGEEGIIIKIKGRGQFRRRLMEMGFIAGKRVTVIRKAPLRDPIEYFVMGYNVSLRNSEAKLIEVDRNLLRDHPYNYTEVLQAEKESTAWIEKSKNLNIALVGNPNSGKTTLFNFASGAREKVANYAGVTVNSSEATYRQSGYTFSIVDLPGTYSLQSYSPEEVYVRDYIFDNKPDIVINIVDASNLERNLYLTTQLIDMGIQVVIALNMYDELIRKGDSLDYKTLGKLLGIPVVPTVSSRGKGIARLFEKVIKVYENREPSVRHVHVNYGTEIENSVCAIQSKIKIEENRCFTDVVAARYLALELLSKDKVFLNSIKCCVNSDEIIATARNEADRLDKLYTESAETAITDMRYGFIAGALKETLKISEKKRLRKTQIIDNYLTNKYLGIPLFILFLWLTFFTTFRLGGYLQDWMEMGVNWLSDIIRKTSDPGLLRDFMVDGIISGVGGVLVFLPNIIILFLFISFMEDTGYMARAVFIMDKLMHSMGLHGKSFIPLFMGFGCNVPAIMATRIIESRRDRLVTMLIIPFMSCSARLPVYILFISAFFDRNHGLILLILYMIGGILAIISAILLKKVYFRTRDIPFVMELPPYRVPTARSIINHVSFRTGQYLRKIGGVILIASVVIWFLSNFPRNINYSKDYDDQIAVLEKQMEENIQSGSMSIAGLNSIESEISHLTMEKKSEHQAKSIIGSLGRALDPVMNPLGFEWRLTVSIISGLAAKEVVVSTLGILYLAETGEGDNSLTEKLQEADSFTGREAITPLVAFSFMLFILTYFPCIGVVAAIRKEAGGWKWAMFVVFYTTSVAWLLSFIVYQVGSLIV